MIERYQGRQIVDTHIHMHEPFRDAQTVVDYLDKNHVDVGMVLASPLKEGEGSKTEHMPGIQRLYLKGPNNWAPARFATEFFIGPYARKMAAEELDNQRVITAAKERPDRLLAWMFIKPGDDMQTFDAIQAAMTSGEFNAAGIKMHFWIFPTDVMNESVIQAAELARATNTPLVMDVGVNRKRMKRFGELAQKYSDVPIIAAHL
mgnify:FL=1